MRREVDQAQNAGAGVSAKTLIEIPIMLAEEEHMHRQAR